MSQGLKPEEKHLCRLLLELVPFRGDIQGPTPSISMRQKRMKFGKFQNRVKHLSSYSRGLQNGEASF